MKRPLFLILFMTSNLLFVVLIIYKNSRLVELNYAQQRLEKERELLVKEESHMQQELCLLKSRSQVKHYALNELHMKQLTLNEVKRLSHDQCV